MLHRLDPEVHRRAARLLDLEQQTFRWHTPIREDGNLRGTEAVNLYVPHDAQGTDRGLLDWKPLGAPPISHGA